jgi:SOS response regulatory protein OraA/RecX
MEDTDRLKNYYYFLISKRDYTRSELYKKAKLKKYSEEIIAYFRRVGKNFTNKRSTLC